jgi:hypothetical protein
MLVKLVEDSREVEAEIVPRKLITGTVTVPENTTVRIVGASLQRVEIGLRVTGATPAGDYILFGSDPDNLSAVGMKLEHGDGPYPIKTRDEIHARAFEGACTVHWYATEYQNIRPGNRG